VKNKSSLTIRYIGLDFAMRYVLQRGDFKFWTGDGFSRVLDNAKVFRSHDAAATAVAALQYQQYKGKPIRAFKLELSIVLAADDVGAISTEAMTKWLAQALRLDVSNSEYGDGPVEGAFVQARLRLATLEETVPNRKHF
jgi:hypothetical protein